MRKLVITVTAALLLTGTLTTAVFAENEVEKGVRHDNRELDKGAEHDAKEVDKGAKHDEEERHKADKHVDKEAKKHL